MSALPPNNPFEDFINQLGVFIYSVFYPIFEKVDGFIYSFSQGENKYIISLGIFITMIAYLLNILEMIALKNNTVIAVLSVIVFVFFVRFISQFASYISDEIFGTKNPL